MARGVAELAKGSRISDYISPGVVGKTFSWERIQHVLRRAGKVKGKMSDYAVRPPFAPIPKRIHFTQCVKIPK